jgi:hypothetical protein
MVETVTEAVTLPKLRSHVEPRPPEHVLARRPAGVDAPVRRRGALAAIFVASALGGLVLVGALYYALHLAASARGFPAAGTGVDDGSASSAPALAIAPSAEASSPPSAAPVTASETVEDPPPAASSQAPRAGVVPGRPRPSPKTTGTALIYSPD